MINLTRSAILTLPADLNVLDAIDRINQAQTGFALVVDPCLVGIFTERHLFQAIATRVELATLTLADLMTRSPIALHESDAENLTLVLQQFQHHQLQYLPVVDDRGQPVGVISHDAVVEALQNQIAQQTVDRQQAEADRQRAEAELQASEQRLFTILESSPLPIFIKDLQGRYTLVNHAYEQMTQRDRSQLLGITDYQLLPADFAEVCWTSDQAALSTHQPIVFEEQVPFPDQARDVLVTKFPIYDAAGQPSAIGGILVDITDRKQMEAALRGSTQRFCEIAETINQAFFVRSASSGAYLYISPAYEQIWGRSCASLYQDPQSWLNDIHPDDRAIVSQSLGVQFQGNPATRQYRIIRPDGSLRWVRVNVSLVNDAAGNPLRFVGVIEDITERQQSEEKLNESQRFVGSITNASPNLIYVYDLIEQHNIYTNYDIDRILNYSSEDVQTMGSAFLPMIMHPEDFAAFGKHCQRMMAAQDQEILEFDYRMRHKNGEWRWFHSRDIVFLRSADGRPKQILGAAMDITDRKQMEAALQQSQQRYRAIVEDQTELIVRYQADTTLTFVNEAYCRYFGLDREKMIGHTYSPVIVADDRQHVTQLVNSLSVENPVVTIENRVIAANGEIRWTQWINRVILDPQNQIVEFQAVGRDITDRKQIEIALQESEEKFRQLAAHIQDVFWIVSPDDFSLYVSPAFEKVWGQSVAVVYHNLDAFFDSIHPDDRARVRHITSERNQQGGASDLEYRIIKPDGEIRWIHDRGFPICNASGQVYRVVGIASDITDRKQAEESLQQAKAAAEAANHAKSEFLSRMSHELRTPLTSVLGFADLIAKDTDLSPEHQAHLAIIRRSGTHLLNLINSVLEMSRIEAGELTLNETSFDLHRLLENIKDLFQLKAAAKGLMLSVSWNPDLPQHIQTDENKLRQILINLLDNAIKFTDTGRVTLRVSTGASGESAEPQKAGNSSQEPGMTGRESIQNPKSKIQNPKSPLSLCFQIEDTGAGIAPNELAVLFNAFTQTEAGRKLQQGTGLGLAISRQFVQMMAGEITVASQVGQGTTLTFTIQATLTEAHAAPSSLALHQTVMGLATSATYRILIVDDQPETRRILAKLLKPIGFAVQEAANGQEAVALWQNWQPHLIWMDMRMPIMDGYTATREIRAREQARRKAESGNVNEDPIHPSSPIPHPSSLNSSLIPHPSIHPAKIIALTANAFDQQRSSALAAGCDDFVVKPFRHTDILQKMAEHLAVEYRYTENQPLAKIVETIASPDASLPVTLPAIWRADLRDAALRLHSHQCLKLIEQIPETHRLLAQMLIDRVNCFQFDAIVDWVEQTGDR